MSASPTQSPELSRANPPAGPYFDLLDISGSPSSSSSPPAPLMAPIYPTSYGYHSSPPPITDYSIRLEKMSCIALFAILRLCPEGTVIGINEENNFIIYKTNNIISRLISGIWRTFLGHHGEHLYYFINPIKEACNDYDPSNKDVGFISFIAFQGAQGLKNYYEKKNRTKVLPHITEISDILLRQAQHCHSLSPIPEDFRPQETLFLHVMHYPLHSTPTSAPITIPKPTLTTLETPFWSPKSITKFASLLKKSIYYPATDEDAIEKRLQKLMNMINTHTKAYAAADFRAPYGHTSPYSGRR